MSEPELRQPVFRFKFIGGPMNGMMLSSDSHDPMELVAACMCWQYTEKGRVGSGFLYGVGSQAGSITNYKFRDVLAGRECAPYLVTESYQWRSQEIEITVEYRGEEY
jgi:hypothetical protein